MSAKMRKLKKLRGKQRLAASGSDLFGSDSRLSLAAGVADVTFLGREYLPRPSDANTLLHGKRRTQLDEKISRELKQAERLRRDANGIQTLQVLAAESLRAQGELGAIAELTRDQLSLAVLRRNDDAFAAFQGEAESAKLFQQNVDSQTTFMRELESARSMYREIEEARSGLRGMANIVAFQREFSSIDQFQKHTEKALAFQQEVDRAAAFRLEVDAATKLTDEMKRQVFIKLRDENYLASLRLEGFDVRSDNTPVTLEELRSKYVR